MNLLTKKKKTLQGYVSPACSCFELAARGSFLVGSPFEVGTENFDAPANEDGMWI